MSLPNPNPALETATNPYFQDNDFVRGPQLRNNNVAIYGNLTWLDWQSGTQKSVPAGADQFGIADSAVVSNPYKYITWTNILTALSLLYAPIVTTSTVWLQGGNGYGSSGSFSRVRRFTNVIVNIGSDITYADSSTNGAKFTLNTTGRYAISHTADNGGGGGWIGLSVNSNQGSTDIGSINAANRLTSAYNGDNLPTSCSWVGKFTAGDFIWAHSNGQPNGTNSTVHVICIQFLGA